MFVVGLGASAGDLKALEQFFAAMPSDSGAAFVVVQHLSPDFESLRRELLLPHTNMPVQQATDGLPLQPNQVYLTPPVHNLLTRNGCLHLVEQSPRPRSQVNLPINLFFQSLAKDWGERTIGIVLSGGGDDGSQGLQTIRAAGVLTLAQDPATAEFSTMPQSVIDAGAVDRILQPDELARLTYEYIQRQGEGYPPVSNRADEAIEPPLLRQILDLLEESEKLDFSYYKASTLSRRTYLRCSLAGCTSIDAYVEYLKNTSEERQQLKNDFLIGVTRFFRDPEAWQTLEHSVLPELLTAKKDQREDAFRVWVPACATGEEAYSLAILVDQLMAGQERRPSVKIFATDVDTHALQQAAEGIYPEQIANDVPPPLLQRYFTWRNGQFHIKRRLRETIIFAPHNLVENPGFTNMHLISCRNVLIYMQPDSQQQVLRTLHLSLASKGGLFLGECENLGALQEEFVPLSEKWKIFQKRRDVRLPLLNVPHSGVFAPITANLSPSLSRPEIMSKSPLNPLLQQAMVNVYGPRQATCVLLDEGNNLLHVVVDAAQLLKVPQGEVTQLITAMLPTDLQVPVSTALNRARRELETVTYTGLQATTVAGDRTIRLTATHTASQPGFDGFSTLVLEDDHPEILPQAPNKSFQLREDTSQRVIELEYELQQSRASLQATIEELETINEAQQATNEEMLAANEELQSTNEEFHSVNEELYTVNAEYQAKIAELTELTADFNHLLQSTDIGVIFLDLDLCIRKFTEAATAAVNLVESDIDRPLVHLTHHLEGVNLLELLQQVLHTERPIEQEVHLSTTGENLLMRIHPYRQQRGTVDGLVMTFINIDELKETERQLSETLELLETTYATTPVGLCLLNADLRYIRINPVLAEIDGPSVADHLGKTPREILPDLADTLEPILRQVIETGTAITNIEVTGTTPAAPDHLRHWIASYYPVSDGVGAVVTEVTELKRAQQTIAENEARLDYLLSTSPAIVFTCAPADNYRCLSISDNVQEILGYTPDDFIHNPDFWLNHLHPADRDRVLAGLQAWDKQNPYNHEYRLLCADGVYRWLDARLKMIQDPTSVEDVMCIGSLVDATERKAAQIALVKNESLFRLTLDQSEIMVFTQDRDLIYQWIYSPIAGFTEADFLHKTDWDAFPTADLQQLTAIKQQVLTSQTRQAMQFRLPQAGGDRYFNIKLEPLRDFEGTLSGIAGVAYEITEEKQIALALSYANQQAQAASQAKSRFLAAMSHELRTPLNAILGMTENLQEGILGPISNRQSSALATIEQSGTHLLNLINDILDISKVEAGQLEPDWASVAVLDLCHGSVALVSQQAQKKQIALTLNLPDDIPDLWGDARRLRQVLVNLLDNAIKFTPTGGQVTLSAQTEGDHINLSVLDTGIGIAAEEISTLFQPFTQVESDLSRQYDGTGLGLALVKQLTELHGGEIRCTSTVGVGSCFSVVLPVQSPLPQPQPSPAFRPASGVDPSVPLPPSAEEDTALILLAEDNETNIETTTNYLEAKGYRLMVARNGVDAVAMARDEKPDLILMDVQMPGMDGLEAIQRIRQASENNVKKVPIIALTALVMPGDRERCLQAGANEYMSKPVKFKALVAKVQELLAPEYSSARGGETDEILL
jgi:PAS domain S-box-containing protein